MRPQKPQIDYPCQWEYRIITDHQEAAENAIFELLHKPYTLIAKNKSARGNFISMNLTLEVESQQERDSLFQQLSKLPCVKIVI